MKLTPTIQRCILHWGEMGSRWGVSRSVAQIHALLFLTPDPLTADAIAETLSIARSNVSVSLKELQGWDLVSITHVMGDRRDYFQARKDIWEVLTTIMDGRKRREIDPTLQMLRECAEESKRDHDTPQDVKERITAMLEFLEEASGWYEQVRAMPRPTLLVGDGLTGDEFTGTRRSRRGSRHPDFQKLSGRSADRRIMLCTMLKCSSVLIACCSKFSTIQPAISGLTTFTPTID